MPFLYKECVELAQTAVGCRVIKLPTAKRKIHEKQYCGVLKRVDTRYKVTVVWDDGTEETVQLPDQELLIYDTSAAGNRNRGVTCDACKLNDISGPRFKCLVCYDFDLCYKCYHAGKHDKSHRFSRIMYCMGWTELPERSKSSTCVVIGIMAGSKVKQGPDWPSNDDSVGKNETGKVTELIDWKDAFYDSGVKVAWEATTSKYRLGYNGNSDVQLAEEDTTLTLYQEHLLNLSEYFNFCFSMNVDQPLIGDKVIISASPSDLEKFQSEHGGYSKEMEEYRAKIGSVIQIIQSSDVVVVFTDTKRFRFNPKAMKIVKTFEEVADSFQESQKKLKIGAKVQITTDEENCKRLQRFHGEWNEMMGQFIRKVGTLIRYDNDDDAVVAFNKRTISFIYNPTLLEAYEGKESTSDEQDFTEEMNQKNIQHNVSVSETSSFIPMVGCSVVSLSRKIESKYCVLGTISEVHTNKLMVVWSNGIKETVTADSCNTLCLYDSAVAGVTHEDKKCKTCTECPIYGTLWKCYDCMDFHLCSDCYHNNEHSLQHKFWRLAKPGDKKTLVPCRNNSTSNLVSGVLPGATVKRGLNWLWGDEDGGVGSTGKVLELKDWDDESPRSAAKIKWNNDQQKTYRAGFNGELELIVVKPNPRQCYVCHLPNLDLKGFVSEKTVSMSSKEYEPSEHIDKFGSQAIEEEEPVITSLKLPKPEVTYNLEDVFVGSRVVKGSGWEFDETRIVKKTESDIGNLKENVKMLGTVTSTDKVVMVTWDDGQDEIYDIVECRDLLLFQSAPAGIKHPGIGCNSCLATTIYGVLWSCQECNDINLCSNCYFNDKHDKDHAFYRKNNSSENRVLVAPRSEEEPGLVTGLLVGSIVQFSEDSTICSNGEKGKIISLCNLAPNYPNSGVRVKLNDGSIKTARVGFKGKVDLKVETLTSDNIPCYFQHLPTLGGKIVGTNKDEQPAQPVQKEPSVHTAPAAQTARDAQETVPDEPPVPKQNSRTSEYGSMGTNKAESPQEPADDVTIGQRVYIVGSPDNINLLYKQAEVRGFEDDNLVVYLLVEKKIIRCGRGAVMTSSQVPDEMLEQSRRQAAEAGYEFDDEEEQDDSQVISSNVEEETAPKDPVSEEQKMNAKEDENQSYVASDDRATQVNKDDGFEVGDQVKTTLAPEVLKSLQKGHGGWNSQMVQYIGEVGTVTQIDNDEDVRVHYMDGRRFYYNPAALTVFRHFDELKPTSGSEIQVGDKVSINLEEDVVRVMQEGHGGWNDDMTRLLQKVGTVIMVQQCGDLSVRFECGTAKTFNPHIFRKLTKYDASVLVAKEKQDEPKCPFKVGDKVRVISNVREAVRIQRNKGSWDFKLTAIVGKFGTVKRVSGIIVSVHFALTDKTFQLNHQLLKKYESGDMEEYQLVGVPFQIGDKVKNFDGRSSQTILNLLPGMADKENEVGIVKGYDHDLDVVVQFADNTKMAWKTSGVRLATKDEIKMFGVQSEANQLKIGDRVRVELGGGFLANAVGRAAGIRKEDLENLKQECIVVGFDDDNDPVVLGQNGDRFALPRVIVRKVVEIPPLFTDLKIGDTVEIDWSGLDDITGAFGSRSVYRDQTAGRTGTIIGFDGLKDPEVLFSGGRKKVIPLRLVKKVELDKLLSQTVETVKSEKSKPPSRPQTAEKQPKKNYKFEVGTSVCIRKKFNELLKEQEDHGGWNNEMLQVLYAVGEVDGYDEDGDIKIMYENGKLWTMNPELLEEATMAEIKAGVLNPVTATKIKHQIGDEVTVSLPLERVKSLQADHGGWKDDMSEILSTTGIVMGMDQDEDLVVKYESGKTYFLNPDLFKSSTKSNHSSVQTECEYKIGEWVRVSSDKEHVINLQEDAGLTTKLSTILGKTVRVSDVKSTRIITVKFRGDDYSLDTRVVTKPR